MNPAHADRDGTGEAKSYMCYIFLVCYGSDGLSRG